MAKLVAVIGAPHRPALPQEVARAPGELEAEVLVDDQRAGRMDGVDQRIM